MLIPSKGRPWALDVDPNVIWTAQKCSKYLILSPSRRALFTLLALPVQLGIVLPDGVVLHSLDFL